MSADADIALNLATVRRRIEAAAHRAHRPASSITLVAVSKTFSPPLIRLAAGFGQRVFGENRVQEVVSKAGALGDLSLEWQLVGHLQSNKARKAVATCQWIQSVDSHELLLKLDQAAAELQVRRSILLQVDLAHEATKHGAAPATLLALARAAVDAKWLDLQGLMIVPPAPAQADDSRPWFRQLRTVRDALVSQGLPAARLAHLSMGMSGDFEVAIEEGATIVRVGSAIFGGRPAAPPTP
jgi:PLP dependent protein